MSLMTSATPKLTVPPRSPARGLPLVVTFEQDDAVNKALGGVLRYRRTYFSDLGKFPAEVDRVLITSSERLLEEHGRNLHAPNIRILGLSEARFKDYRLDGLVYAYVIPGTPIALIERMIDNALDHIHLVASRQEVNARLAFATREINELNQIGAALSAEHDTGKLLEMILTKCREITSSDAGSLYVVEEDERESKQLLLKNVGDEPVVRDAERSMHLRFKLAQNDSVSVPFREVTMEISEKSIAGYVAQTGLPVNIEDAYHLAAGVPYTINRKFDEDSGYRTKSILAVPMKNQKGDVVGVVQLINAKRDVKTKLASIATVVEQVIPFTERQQEIVASLASQAAVAYENSQLYEAIQKLFEGFVRASVVAIESRDPTTSGHSFRVANLTVALAEAVDRADGGSYGAIHFSRSEMKEIRYASLLHDFGKVGVREEVLVKAKKLYPAQVDVIKQRFQFVKRSMETEALRSRLSYVLEKGREEYLARQGSFDQELAAQLAEVDKWFQIILAANEPTILPDGSFDVLHEIAARHYKDYENAEYPLLDPQEVKLLSIRKGSLDDAERLQIESHVIHTFNFLQQIPWTKEIRSIPEIARAHHEKLNGKGYPYRLSAPEIPVQTRIMTISDIYDALCAVDRPYKKAVNLDRALEILGFAVKDGEIDAGLFELFKEAKVYEKWKIEPFPY
jgi:HD-GYP domain-containing protein (c-di-GMP phosphodiesterase class II)